MRVLGNPDMQKSSNSAGAAVLGLLLLMSAVTWHSAWAHCWLRLWQPSAPVHNSAQLGHLGLHLCAGFL